MLLVLTLVCLSHRFQTRAAPLTSPILAESAKTAISSTLACVCPTDQRSIWDILWSSLATIFACSWVSIHPNIPAPNETRWRVLLRRIELMFWAVIGPELVIVWAFRQWLGAGHLKKLYKERGWTRTHGYFIQMGGFMLFEGDVAKGVLSQEMFSDLLTAGKIEFPNVTVEEIEDRSKADGLSKTIAVGQTLWFIAQCLARRAQHLDITLIELLTLSLAVLNGVMYFLWWHKPLDVCTPVRVYLLDEPNEHRESNKSNKSNDPNELNEPNKSDESNKLNEHTEHNEHNEPVEIGNLFGLYPIFKSAFLAEESAAHTETAENQEQSWQEAYRILPIPAKIIVFITWTIFFLIIIPIAIAAIAPLIAVLIVIIAAVVAAVVALLVVAFAIFLPLVLIALPMWLIYLLGNRWINMLFEDDDFNTGIMKVPTFYSSKLKEQEERATLLLLSITGVIFGGIHCTGWFFTFPSSNEAILWRVSAAVLTGIAFLIPSSFYLIGVVSSDPTDTYTVLLVVVTCLAVIAYVVSRLILLVEAFISLRHLTPGMLAVVKWTSFIPHI